MESKFKILQKNSKEFQMLLNQWRHRYDVFIHYVNYYRDSDIWVVLIERNDTGEEENGLQTFPE